MIVEYLRPTTIAEALTLLGRKEPLTLPLGGGTYLNRPSDSRFTVVDLQSLDLGAIARVGNTVELGACATLAKIIEFNGLPDDLYTALKHEATYNLRQQATIAGTLMTATGRSPLTTVLLSMDVSLEIQSLNKNPWVQKLGDWLPLRQYGEPGSLITKMILPANVRTGYESISRTPADQSIVIVAVTQWHSGRTRLALGGYSKAPIMAMDGPEADGIESAARNAYSSAGDEWASAEYRMEMAGILASRCLSRIKPG